MKQQVIKSKGLDVVARLAPTRFGRLRKLAGDGCKRAIAGAVVNWLWLDVKMIEYRDLTGPLVR